MDIRTPAGGWATLASGFGVFPAVAAGSAPMTVETSVPSNSAVTNDFSFIFISLPVTFCHAWRPHSNPIGVQQG
jgi:hypothetical protein